MSKLTTEDCKLFILKELSLDNSITIKRLKKYKNEAGLYVRDFEISNGQMCSVLEQTDGSLSIINAIIGPKKFTNKELAKAARHLTLINSYNIKAKSEDKDKVINDDDVQKMIDDDTVRSLLPSQFWFNFPEGIHSNLKDNIKNGLETQFINSKDKKTFYFKIMTKNEDFEDQSRLLETIDPLIKDNFIRIEECLYEFNPNSNNKNMTVKEVKEYLENTGFKYNKTPNNSQICLFKEYVKEEPKSTFNAKKYLKNILKALENGDRDPTEGVVSEIKNMSVEDRTKIANEFYFYFPNETYNNDIEIIKNGAGLDTLMYQPNSFGEYFCFTFHDSFNSEPDLYLSGITLGILPSYFDFVDEYNVEPKDYKQKNPEYIKSLTIRDVIKILQDLGFKYKNPKDLGEYGCMLHQLKIKV